MYIHNRLVVIRAERGVTRSELAKAIDVNPQTIGFIERGDYSPSIELAFKISNYFNLPLEAIFSDRPFKSLSEEVYGYKGDNK